MRILKHLNLLFHIVAIACIYSHAVAQDSIRVSLITCYPGPEVYELCGHSAIRIKTSDSDSVWNYGIFNFNEPNFVYRFVKGETDYMLGGYPFAYFMPEYIQRNSKVVEQVLDLTAQEASDLRKLLQTKALPANRTYRYKYLSDNCATRISNNLDSVTAAAIIYPDSIAYGTYRKAMRAYHHNYPWYQFGIDIALGSGIDRPITAQAEGFSPLRLNELVGNAHYSDGRPLVKETRTLFEGSTNAILPPTPWYGGPLFWSIIILVISLVICLYDWIHKVLSRWWYCLYFIFTGLAGCIVTFLVFVSAHEATSPNILIWWLNPLGLIIAAGMWWKGFHKIEIALISLNFLAVTILLIIWPMQPQNANPAFFPLMLSSAILSAVYTIISSSESYNPERGIIKSPQKKILGNKKPRKQKSSKRK